MNEQQRLMGEYENYYRVEPWWVGTRWMTEGAHKFHRTVTEDVWYGRILDYCKDCDLYYEIDNDPASIGYVNG